MTTMHLTTALPYVLKEGDQLNFLTADEADALNRRVADAIEGLRPEAPRTVVLAREVRMAYLASVDLTSRATGWLLRQAVTYRFGEKMVRKDGKAWGRVQDALDDPADGGVELSPADAVWIVDVFFHAEALDKFPPAAQGWLNVLEPEMARLREVVRPSKTQQVPEA